MENNTNLSLKEFLTLCLNFEDDPTTENDQKITDFLGKLIVKDYMPLSEKAMHAVEILSLMERSDYDAPGATTANEIYQLFYGLCSYAINLDIDIGPLINTASAYDKCVQYGLQDHILSYCEDDYGRFVHYCDSMININNIHRLLQTASLINNTEFDKWAKELQKLQKTFTPEVVKSLESYAISSTTHMKDLSDIIANKVVNGVNSQIRDEEMKRERIIADLENEPDDEDISQEREEDSLEQVNKNDQIGA